MLIKILLNSAAVYLTAELLAAVYISDFVTALLVALVLGIINVTIKPVVKLLTLPINILTLGLFGFIINGAALYLVTFLIDGFVVSTFWWAVLASILITFFTTLFSALIGAQND